MTIAQTAAALRTGGPDIPLDMLAYARTLALRADREDDAIMLAMPFDARLIGAPGRLHGGAVAGLLEVAGLARLLIALEPEPALPSLQLITCTVDYLREGGPQATFATATLTRIGRRVANLHAVAWQAEPGRPIASARLNYLLDRG